MSLQPIVVNAEVESTAQTVNVQASEVIRVNDNYRLVFTDENNDGNIVISEA